MNCIMVLGLILDTTLVQRFVQCKFPTLTNHSDFEAKSQTIFQVMVKSVTSGNRWAVMDNHDFRQTFLSCYIHGTFSATR